MMKLFCCLFLVVSLQNLVQGLECVPSDSKKCVIISLVSADTSFSEVTLPNLDGKSSLLIKAGNLTIFGEKMSNQLKSVEKLQLGQLGLKELFLNTELVEVIATDNQIHVVKLKSLEANYKLQTLNLQRNCLKHLNGFEVLTNLIELRLEDNQLESIDFSIFGQMHHLRKLYLDRNHLTDVMTTTEISMPMLESLSLAENMLTELDVSRWNFPLLMEWNLSSNYLIYVDGLGALPNTLETRTLEGFPKLETIFLSKNGWYCEWLNTSLNVFQNNGVAIGDADKGDNKQNVTKCDNNVTDICCVKVEVLGDTESVKLDNMNAILQELRTNVIVKLSKLEEDQNNKLKKLENDLDQLETKSNEPVSAPSEPSNVEELNELIKKAKKLKSRLDGELEANKKQIADNEILVKNLEYSILQLRKSLRQAVGTISGLQGQFKFLRETTNKHQN